MRARAHLPDHVAPELRDGPLTAQKKSAIIAGQPTTASILSGDDRPAINESLTNKQVDSAQFVAPCQFVDVPALDWACTGNLAICIIMFVLHMPNCAFFLFYFLIGGLSLAVNVLWDSPNPLAFKNSSPVLTSQVKESVRVCLHTKHWRKKK